MLFGKKKPKRLYYPTKSRWYRRPRKRRRVQTARRTLTHQLKSKISQFFKGSIILGILATTIIIAILYIGFSGHFAITKIDVARDNLHIDSAEITNQLNHFKGKNIFFFSRYNIQKTIKENYPEFSIIHIKKVLPHTLKIELETHEIVANIKAYYQLPEVENPPDETEGMRIEEVLRDAFILIENEEEEEENAPIEQKALLNRIGQAIFDQEEDLGLMTIVIENLTQPIEDREIVIPEHKMDFILESIQYFNNTMRMVVDRIKYLPVAREVHFVTEDDLIIWLSMEKDYKEQIDKLNVIYQAAELDKEDIDYIDLRIDEKLIYCPRRSQCGR